MVGTYLIFGMAFAQQKIIFDCDIADDIDDAYAIGLLTQVPNVKILGVTTTFGDTAGRAKVAAKLLHEFERSDIPIFCGKSKDVPHRPQFDWAKDTVSKSIKPESAVEFMHREVNRSPGQITIIAVGPLTNLGELIIQYPKDKTKIGNVVIMGGAFYVGYNNQTPINTEWNIVCDPSAARTLFNSGVPVTCAGLEVTSMMQFDDAMRQKLTAFKTKGTEAMSELKNLWGTGDPTFFDPVAVAYATGFKFSKEERVHLEVDDKGFTHIAEGSPKVTILVQPQKKEFLDWYIAMFAPRKSATYRAAAAKQVQN
jgi:inosine-uridine nucleoside N-ribohydrolase